MAVRRTLSNSLFRTIRGPLEDFLQHRSPQPDPSVAARITTLEEQNSKLEKKLSMAMGAIQAATAQIVQLRTEIEATSNLSHQAMQKATSAQATAEASSEGITSLETILGEKTGEEKHPEGKTPEGKSPEGKSSHASSKTRPRASKTH